MKFFKTLLKKPEQQRQPPQRQQPPRPPPSASASTGAALDIERIYSNQQPSHPRAPHPHPRPPQTIPSTPQQQQHESPYRQVKTTSADGKRVTTTVRVPPQQSMLPPKSGSAMEEEETITALTRDLVKKFIADIWNRGEVDLIPDVCSPSLRFNGNNGFDRVGHDGLARMVGTIRDALDDYHCEIHSMVVEHNKAFCRLRFTGKHTGNLLGYEPTNKTVAWMGATEFTCQNGKILKVWELGDVKSLEEQISSHGGADE